MKRVVLLSLCMLLAAGFSAAQTASPATQAPTGHGAFPAKVTKTLESSKLKEDDSIEVEIVGAFKLPDGTVVPKGSKLTGRVLLAKARSKGDPDSQLTLTFNRLAISGAKDLSLKGTLQAVYPPADAPQDPNMSTMGTSLGGSGGGGRVVGGGAGGGNSGGVGITNSHPDASTPQMSINMKASGAVGMSDLSLENGVLSSKGKQVKLGTGVRLVVQAEIY